MLLGACMAIRVGACRRSCAPDRPQTCGSCLVLFWGSKVAAEGLFLRECQRPARQGCLRSAQGPLVRLFETSCSVTLPTVAGVAGRRAVLVRRSLFWNGRPCRGRPQGGWPGGQEAEDGSSSNQRGAPTVHAGKGAGGGARDAPGLS